MGKKKKSLVTEAFPIWESDKDVVKMMAEKRKLQYIFDDKPRGKSSVKVVGKTSKVCKFEKDLHASKLVRTLGAFEQLEEGLRLYGKAMARCLGSRDDMEVLSIVTGKNGYLVTIGNRKDEEDHGTAVLDHSGVCGEAPRSKENRILMDQERPDSGEDGYLPDKDSGRPEDTGEGTGETLVGIPVEDFEEGEWVTEAEYSARYNVPSSTVGFWARKGELRTKNTQPRLVLDGQKVPIRDRNGKRPRWIWVDRDILEDANSLVSEEL